MLTSCLFHEAKNEPPRDAKEQVTQKVYPPPSLYGNNVYVIKSEKKNKHTSLCKPSNKIILS